MTFQVTSLESDGQGRAGLAALPRPTPTRPTCPSPPSTPTSLFLPTLHDRPVAQRSAPRSTQADRLCVLTSTQSTSQPRSFPGSPSPPPLPRMSLLQATVSQGDTILVNCQLGSRDFSQAIGSVLSRIPPNDSKLVRPRSLISVCSGAGGERGRRCRRERLLRSEAAGRTELTLRPISG